MKTDTRKGRFVDILLFDGLSRYEVDTNTDELT